jgi:Ca2+-binding RTX toxin-like protein
MKSNSTSHSGHDRRRYRGTAGAAVCLLATGLSVAAQGAASHRDDLIIAIDPASFISISANGTEAPVSITSGLVNLEANNPAACHNPTAANPCVMTVNLIRLALNTFSFSGHTVTQGSVVINGPIAVTDQGGGITIPAGTPAFATAVIEGSRFSSTTPLPADGHLNVDVAEQQATADITVDLSFDVDGNTIAATGVVFATSLTPFVNLPPVANAGPDQQVPCPGPVTLNGSASTDPNDSPTTFVWSEGGAQLGVGTIITPVLGAGTHNILLEVFDRFGARGTDSVTVTVANPAPVFTFVPAAITTTSCGTLSVGNAQATSACGTVTVTRSGPTSFFAGESTVTFTATSSTGTVATATTTVTVLLDTNAACCPPGTHVIVGTSNNDVINGTTGNDCILGLGGQDTISGGGGNDVISGGDGDDIIDGGAGNDILFGGTGQDTMTGGTGDDLLFGGDGDDTMHGNDGNDRLHGGLGQDHIFGDNNDDQLFGDDGDDQLNGGTGNDLLNGGGLHDTCTGGGGTDTFVTCQTRL